jgi:hypothetical protein
VLINKKKNESDDQLYDPPKTDCHFNKGLNTSISVVSLFATFLRNQLTTDIKGLL